MRFFKNNNNIDSRKNYKCIKDLNENQQKNKQLLRENMDESYLYNPRVEIPN